MTGISLQEPIQAVLLDIEGTTTPIDFVYQTLFPYARRHLHAYLSQQPDKLQTELAALRAEHVADVAQEQNPPALTESALVETATDYLLWMMERDRKSTPLKTLQGQIWEAGYRAGELKSAVYADVPHALARWQAQGRRVCIYSSGSVLAQQLLFKYTEAGDLTPFLSGYFDTKIGAKREAESYRRIAAALQLPTAECVFCSDVTAELTAAQAAGMQTVLLVRPGNPPQPDAQAFGQAADFARLLPESPN
jgi:enolase-phosphatase E1